MSSQRVTIVHNVHEMITRSKTQREGVNLNLEQSQYCHEIKIKPCSHYFDGFTENSYYCKAAKKVG